MRPEQEAAQELYRAWLVRHGQEWSRHGAGITARGYANVVADQRCGVRSSLHFAFFLAPGSNRDNRRRIRDQIDNLMIERAGGRKK